MSAARNGVEVFRSFKLRGFNMLETVIDGIRNTSSLSIQADGLASVERVEILRGPGGAVFGIGSPGGVINIVTKKPLATAHQELQLGVGTFGHVQPQVDLTRPLLARAKVRYRLIGSYEQRSSYINFVKSRAAQIAPTIDYLVTDRLLLRYQGDWRERSQLRYVSLPFLGTISGSGQRLPRSLFTGEPDQGNTENRGYLQSIVLEHSRGESGKTRVYARFNQNRFDQPSIAPRDVLDDLRTLRQRFNGFIETDRESVVGAQWVAVTANLSTGGFFDGRLDRMPLAGRWSPNPYVSLRGNYELNSFQSLGLRDSAFVTHLAGPGAAERRVLHHRHPWRGALSQALRNGFAIQ